MGIGAVLMQSKRPIAYFSQALAARHQVKSVYERELMAIVLEVRKWRHYLLGHHFIIKTDQRALKYLLEQRELGSEQQRWVSKLLGYSFEIHYKLGKENKVADALSRREVVEFKAFTVHHMAELMQWEEVKQDDKLSLILQQIITNKDPPEGYNLRNGCLLFQGRLVLPKDSPRIPKLIAEFHNTPMGGHSGYLRTYKRIASVLFWEGMKKQVQEFVAKCTICQQNKYEARSPAGLLQPLPIPKQVWEDINLDFITGLPKSNRFDTIFVVVDRLTKYAHFVPLSHPYSASDVAAVFIKEVVKLHGIPRSIVSDRDRLFMSNFWQELFKSSGTTLARSSAYHPSPMGKPRW